jgi:hypothetical protein
MPTPDQVDVLVGDKPHDPAKPVDNLAVPPTPPVPASPEEYQKVVEIYDNVRTAYNKRDREISDLRKRNEELEKKVQNPSKPAESDESDDDSEDAQFKARLERLGYVPADSIEESVNRKLTLQQKVEELQRGVKEAMVKYPFVSETELLEYMGSRNISVDEALQLKYGPEIQKFTAATTDPNVPETDAGGRTLIVESKPGSSNDAPLKRALPKGHSFSNFMRDRLQEAQDVIDGRK